MSSAQSTPLVITRVAERHWHALADDRTVGRGEALPRPDGRLFVSIDSWHDTVFHRLAEAMVADLPSPLYTVVDEADRDLAANWVAAGFTIRRREWDYEVPTDPRSTGLDSARPPANVTILAGDAVRADPLRELDRTIRAEIEATVGWHTMPAEVVVRPLDPANYVVAAKPDRYVGLLRLATLTRRPRIGLIAVRADHHRRGIARALLADALGRLHRAGTGAVSAEVTESNTAAAALFDEIGARRVSRTLELVRG
jgi:GNAT superfamily N-acetyltransferase